MRETITRVILDTGGKKISRDLKALYSHRVLLRIGFGITTVFTVALIYQYFNNSFLAVAAVYGAMHVLVFFFTPLSSMIIRYLGIRSMLLLAVPAVILSTVGLYQFASGGPNALLGLIGFSLLMAIYKVFYWVPYQVDFSLLLDRRRRGSQLALLRNIADIIIVATPLVGGFIIVSLGFEVLYLISIVIITFGMIPIFFIKNAYESYSWSYVRTLKELFSSRNRTLVGAYIGDGIQAVTLLVIWPLIVFILLDERYIALGFITALTLFAVLILRLITGNLFDKWNKSKLIIIGAALASSGWLLKVFVATPFQVFAAETYHGMGRAVNKTSFDAMTYEQAADSGRYVDEYTTLKEMSLALGRVLMLVFTVGVTVYFGLTVAFLAALVVSAAATLATILLKEKVKLQ